VRFYLISGLSHGVGDIRDRGVCQQFTNAVSPYPVHRALLVALDEWVSHGTPPPKSLVPRHSDKSASAVPRPGFSDRRRSAGGIGVALDSRRDLQRG
jgi:hypothetical protein